MKPRVGCRQQMYTKDARIQQVYSDYIKTETVFSLLIFVKLCVGNWNGERRKLY